MLILASKGIRIAFDSQPLTAPTSQLMSRRRTAAELWKADHNYEVCCYAARLDAIDKTRPKGIVWKDLKSDFEAHMYRKLDHDDDAAPEDPEVVSSDDDAPATPDDDADPEVLRQYHMKRILAEYIEAWDALSPNDVPSPEGAQVPYATPGSVTRAQSHVLKRKTAELRRKYQKMAEDEAQGKMTFAARREYVLNTLRSFTNDISDHPLVSALRRAREMTDKECRAFANAMWNQYRVLVLMHIGRVGSSSEEAGMVLSVYVAFSISIRFMF